MIEQHLKKASLAYLLAYSIILGALTGFVTVVFIYILELVTQLIWNVVPTALGVNSLFSWYVIAACTVGGLVLGILLRYLGEYPTSLEDTIAHYKQHQAFDYKHLWQAGAISLVSLGFGASLGPEAALATLVGGLISLSSVRLKKAAAVAYGVEAATKLPRPQRTLLTLAAVAAGWLVFSNFTAGESYFSITSQAYRFSIAELAWIFAVLPAGILAGWLYNKSDAYFEKWLAPSRKQNVILTATAGGLMLGLLAYIRPDVLFSGHENLGYLLSSIEINGLWFFVSLALAKIAATTICLATSWKGGRFLPVLMVGACIGLALATFLPSPAMLLMAVGMSVTLTAVLKKPLIAGLLVACFFPVTIALSVFLAALLTHQVITLLPKVSRSFNTTATAKI